LLLFYFLSNTKVVSNSFDGFSSLSLWGAMKKKPLFTLKNAHGCQATDESKVEGQEENWITSVAALHNSDVVASGNTFFSF
jgi:hypothetical protein